MTIEEFRSRCYDMDSLYEFCCDYHYYDFFDEYYTEDSLDEYLDTEFLDRLRNGDSWRDVRDSMNSIPTDYEWYTNDGWGEWIGVADSDFEELRDNVENDLIRDGFFEETEEVDDYEEEILQEEEVIEIDNIEDLISIA